MPSGFAERRASAARQAVRSTPSPVAPEFTFAVPILPHALLNPNRRSGGHRIHQTSAIAELRTATAYAVPAHWRGILFPAVQVTITYACLQSTRARNIPGVDPARYRPRDVNNAQIACKPLIDGLVDAKIIPDDSAKHLPILGIELRHIDDPRQEGLTVHIRQIDPETVPATVRRQHT